MNSYVTYDGKRNNFSQLFVWTIGCEVAYFKTVYEKAIEIHLFMVMINDWIFHRKSIGQRDRLLHKFPPPDGVAEIYVMAYPPVQCFFDGKSNRLSPPLQLASLYVYAYCIKHPKWPFFFFIGSPHRICCKKLCEANAILVKAGQTYLIVL